MIAQVFCPMYRMIRFPFKARANILETPSQKAMPVNEERYGKRINLGNDKCDTPNSKLGKHLSKHIWTKKITPK